tara:strand:- start:153 stop:1484 length:1332 start_codon:yes stop_codon:yes gene_type:complete
MLVIAKALSISEYALFGQLYAAQQIMITLIGAGYVEVIIRLSYSSELNRMAIYKNALMASGPVTLFFLFLATTILIVLHEVTGESMIGYSFAIVGGCVGGYFVVFSKLNRLLENHSHALLLLYTPLVITFLMGYVFLSVSGQVVMFFLGSLLGFLFSGVVFYKAYIVFFINKFRRSGSIISQINRDIKPYISVAFLGWLSGYGNVFVIKFFLPDVSIAKYTFLYTLSGVMLLVANSMNQVWSPYFYRVSKEEPHDYIEMISYWYYTSLTVLLSLAAGFVIICYQPLMIFLGGNLGNYSGFTIELSLMLTSFIIYTPVWHARNHLYLKSHGSVMLNISILSSLIGFLVMVLSIYMFGDIGIYIGILGLTLSQLFSFCIYSYRKWKSRFPISGVAFGTAIVIGSYLLALNRVDALTLIISAIFFILSCSYILRRKFLEVLKAHIR